MGTSPEERRAVLARIAERQRREGVRADEKRYLDTEVPLSERMQYWEVRRDGAEREADDAAGAWRLAAYHAGEHPAPEQAAEVAAALRERNAAVRELDRVKGQLTALWREDEENRFRSSTFRTPFCK